MPTAYQINWNPVLDHRHAFLLGAWLDVWITLISFALACVARDRDRAPRVTPACARSPGPRSSTSSSCAECRCSSSCTGSTSASRSSSASRSRAPRRRSSRSPSRAPPTPPRSFRAAISSVERGHVEAATALGFTRRASFRHVVFPQAIRIALPPLGNTFIGLLKGATLDLDHRRRRHGLPAQQINLDYFTPFEPFTAVALILSCSSRCSPRSLTPSSALLRLP